MRAGSGQWAVGSGSNNHSSRGQTCPPEQRERACPNHPFSPAKAIFSTSQEHIDRPSWPGAQAVEINFAFGAIRVNRSRPEWPVYIRFMLSFRKRPLTWLFIIATACLDLVAIAHLVNLESDWFGAIAVGQMCLAGSLLAAGQAHRLLRAALFLGVPILLTVPDYLSTGEFIGEVSPEVAREITIVSVAPNVLAISLVITAMASFFSFVLIALNAICVHRSSGAAKAKFQFPIIEFFGWTIVVAVSTIALREGDFGWFDFPLLAQVALFLMFPAAAIVFFHAPRRSWFLKGALFVSAAITVYTLAVQSENLDWHVMLGAYAYLAGWILVKRMDDALAKRREGAHFEAPEDSPSPLADEQ
jgi:hypothetical protein